MLDSGAGPPKGMVVRAAGNTVFRKQDRRYLEFDRNEPVAGPVVEWVSSRTNGGLSNYWTGAVPRFAPEDFTEGAQVDERYRWPLSYDDLADYYRIAEEALVVTAGVPFENIPPNVSRFVYTAATRLAGVRRQGRPKWPSSRIDSVGQGNALDDQVARHRIQQLPLHHQGSGSIRSSGTHPISACDSTQLESRLGPSRVGRLHRPALRPTSIGPRSRCRRGCRGHRLHRPAASFGVAGLSERVGKLARRCRPVSARSSEGMVDRSTLAFDDSTGSSAVRVSGAVR